MKNEINEIWLDFNEELYKFIVIKVKDEHIAKDIRQDVFFKVQKNIHQLKHTSRLTSWIYQITRNTIIDYFRKERKKNVPINTLDIPENEDEDLDYSKLTDCIHQKIENLSAQHKEAIILTTFKNYSQKELAEHLKISYSGTKSRVQTARKILKENILNCPDVTSDNSGKILELKK